MLGLMQDCPLLISQIIDFAASAYSQGRDRLTHRRGRSTARLQDAAQRAKKVAEALQGWASSSVTGWHHRWNTYRHFELYFGISGIGAVRTPSIHGSRRHVAYIANHARTRSLRRPNLLPVVEACARLKTVSMWWS